MSLGKMIPTIAPSAIIHLGAALPILEPEINWPMLMQSSAVGFFFRNADSHYLQIDTQAPASRFLQFRVVILYAMCQSHFFSFHMPIAPFLMIFQGNILFKIINQWPELTCFPPKIIPR